jgi:hypothetical protein
VALPLSTGWLAGPRKPQTSERRSGISPQGAWAGRWSLLDPSLIIIREPLQDRRPSVGQIFEA